MNFAYITLFHWSIPTLFTPTFRFLHTCLAHIHHFVLTKRAQEMRKYTVDQCPPYFLTNTVLSSK